ncbi:cysteine protease, partial [Striga asiatica]
FLFPGISDLTQIEAKRGKSVVDASATHDQCFCDDAGRFSTVDGPASAFNPRIRHYLQDHGVTYEDKYGPRIDWDFERFRRFSSRSDLHRLQRDQVSSGDVRLNAKGTVRKHLCVLTGFGRPYYEILNSWGEHWAGNGFAHIGPAMDSGEYRRKNCIRFRSNRVLGIA